MKVIKTFEEATTEYISIIGENPKFETMCKLYHQYRKTFKEYKWKNFKEFINWNE